MNLNEVCNIYSLTTMFQLYKVYCLFILFITIFVCAKTTTIDCKTFKNKHVELEVADVRQSFDTTELNLVNITLNSNYVLVKHEMSILCRKLLKKLPKVEYFWMPNVGLQEIEVNSFIDMKKLQSINIYGNNVTILRHKTFINLKQLRFISLTNNRITTIQEGSFQNLISLEVLNLSTNDISVIEKNWLSSCRNLRKLNLRRNKLKTITNDMLKNLNTFQWITLSFASNSLEEIENNAFAKFFYVQELSLRNNSIKELPGDFLRSIKQGQTLDVNENQLNCIHQDVVRKFNLIFMTDNPLIDNCKNRLGKMMKKFRIAIF